jgi:hypothetical protein
MSPRIRLPLALCALFVPVGLTVAGASADARPVAHAAAKPKQCASGSPGSLRGGYYLGLAVSGGATCASGRSVQTAYQNCRLKHGLAGRCTTKVLGYTCKERRQAIPTQVTAAVTCTSGKKHVAYTYQQNVV